MADCDFIAASKASAQLVKVNYYLNSPSAGAAAQLARLYSYLISLLTITSNCLSKAIAPQAIPSSGYFLPSPKQAF